MADGAAVRFWRMGQDYWKENRQAIPKHCFDLLGCAAALLESGLAIVEGDFVHVRGASKAYEWLEKRKAAGAKGGRKSAQRSRDLAGKLQAKPKHEPSKTQANMEQNQPSYSYSSSSSFSSSPSSSNSNSNSYSKNNNAGIRIEYPEQFDQLWALYERKGDKKASFEEFKKQKLNEQEVEQLKVAIKNYQEEKPEHVYRKDFERYLKTDWRENLTTRPKQEVKTPKQLLDEKNEALAKRRIAELREKRLANERNNLAAISRPNENL